MVENTTYYNLLTEGKIGKLKLKNRIIMPAMETNLPSITGEVTEDLIRYYEERAKGGPGAIIVEFTGIDSKTGRGSQTQLLLDSHGFISGHNQLVETIHKYNCKAVLQLHHAGRQTTKSIIGETPVSASSIPCKVMKSVPRELTTEEVKAIISKFVKAAARAKKAGYDGVELHAAHGYLLSNFLSPYTNMREDEYGGSTVNRSKIVTDIISGIKEKVDRNFPIIIRFSVDEFVDGGLKIEESIQLAKLFENAGADAIHVSTSIFETMDRNVEPMSFADGWRIPLATQIKENTTIPVIGVGAIRHPKLAEEIIMEGKVDFVAIGRGLLADPNWVKKVEENQTELINQCTSCCLCVERVSFHLPVRCSVNPRAGKEKLLGSFIKGTENVKSFIIIGGGVSGLAAAVFAGKKGHEVTLYEGSSQLGGLLDVASAAPNKHRWLSLKDYLINEINHLGVKVNLNQQIHEKDIDNFKDSEIIISTGMIPRNDVVKQQNIPVLSVLDVLRKKTVLENKRVLVLGSRGAGLEVAHFLTKYNNTVFVLSRSGRNDIGANIDFMNRKDILQEIAKEKVTFITGSDIESAVDQTIYYHNYDKDSVETLPQIDYIVQARGFLSNDPFNAKNIKRIGSSISPRKISDCIREAYDVVELLTYS
jgi:2,4-dienoyl-CoA reductase-like NADH-dependent reductase (Old Yellow Enzyme family)/thioredoxin reductase